MHFSRSKFQNLLPIRFVRSLLDDKIGLSAAALAYYFLIALFPLLLFVGLLLSRLDQSHNFIVQLLSRLPVPTAVVDTVMALLAYTATLDNSMLILTGAVLSVYGGSRAAACLCDAINKSYDHTPSRSKFAQFVINLAFAALFLLGLTTAVLLFILTPQLLSLLARLFPIGAGFMRLWGVLRFFVAFITFFMLLLLLYAVIPDRHIPLRRALPGAIAASIGWMAVSAGVSIYTTHMARYDLLYGSVGALLIVILWLYVSSFVLIAGAHVNRFAFIAAQKMKNRK